MRPLPFSTLLVMTLAACMLVGCASREAVLPPPPGTDADIADAERVGRIMAVHDIAAAQATEEMFRIGVTPSFDAGFAGWITVPDLNGIVVRFVGNDAGRPSAFYDITVSDAGSTVTKLTPPEPLPPLQQAAFRARQLAMDSAVLDCADHYNTVVFQDPVQPGDDWQVYLIPATTVAGRIMLGRQLHLRVAADGRSIVGERALSKDCGFVDRGAVPSDGKLKLLYVTNLATATPNESHVFLNLLEGLPVAVGTSLGSWVIVDGKIRYLGRPNPPGA